MAIRTLTPGEKIASGHAVVRCTHTHLLPPNLEEIERGISAYANDWELYDKDPVFNPRPIIPRSVIKITQEHPFTHSTSGKRRGDSTIKKSITLVLR